MIKEEELSNPRSCLNKAKPGERLFVLRGADPAAPSTIRHWIGERLRLGKNSTSHEQIREADQCASLMEVERLANLPGKLNVQCGGAVPASREALLEDRLGELTRHTGTLLGELKANRPPSQLTLELVERWVTISECLLRHEPVNRRTNE